MRCAALALLFSLVAVMHLTADASANPYSGIIERNSFGLKAPVNPADLIKPPAPVVADIKLQGISTILGRKQVLMKIKVPAKPPEPAKDQSFVFVEGQREGEVEVKEIDPVQETVKVDNAGTMLSLNMKDHSDRPSAGPAGPAAAVLPGAVPGVPSPVAPTPSALPRAASSMPNPAASGGIPTYGGGTSASELSGFGNTATVAGQKTIPSRTLRSSNGNVSPQSAANEFQNISPEAQAILIEAQRTQIQAGGFDPLPKTAITPRDRLQTPLPPQPQ